METGKKPTRWIAVAVTVAAVLCLVTSLLVVSTTPGKLVVTLQLIATIILAAASIGIWHEYSKKFVEYEVERRMQDKS
jgi:uncharacterized membrane-anchored protein